MFTYFYIVFQISLQIPFQIYTTKNIAMFWMYSQNYCSVLYIDSFFLSLIQKWVICRFASLQTGLLFTDYKHFHFNLHPFQYYFTHIETSQENTPGKPPDTTANRTWLVPHVTSAGLEPTPATSVGDRIIKSVEISGLTHSVTGAAITDISVG